MNTYDFDQTIYEPDSSYSFYLFCLKNYPSAVLRTLPKTLAFAAAYGLKRIKTKRLKEQLFSVLRYLPDEDAAVADFWDEHRIGIGQWYLDQKKEDDVIVSASPYFLLRPVARELGVGLIATPMDKPLIADDVVPKVGHIPNSNTNVGFSFTTPLRNIFKLFICLCQLSGY